MKTNNKRSLTSRLAHKIIFLENVTESKIEDPVWQEKCQSFAEILPLSECNYMNLEGFNFGNFITEEYYLFRIRYLEGLNKNMRISYHTKLYSLKRIVNVQERNRMLNIIAHEIV